MRKARYLPKSVHPSGEPAFKGARVFGAVPTADVLGLAWNLAPLPFLKDPDQRVEAVNEPPEQPLVNVHANCASIHLRSPARTS